jgi:hypothetical protein
LGTGETRGWTRIMRRPVGMTFEAAAIANSAKPWRAAGKEAVTVIPGTDYGCGLCYLTLLALIENGREKCPSFPETRRGFTTNQVMRIEGRDAAWERVADSLSTACA